ncbi:3'(2'),5'-bisphosphate nucleotidase CysQ [Dongia rigui]|uniref:3'(2'),5'-bisphosphate nucleotidase CysQ n=1 Tax=Dongia rigui TaxID=940149 RepID=A0ABU5DW65_9PROT|nr:3'(2'),5'-bisphosphate nucleotidase CysQ [Dongia rigui]MDY0871556.1 3'(2'),5'-bisphosphate nucleotidase CysQ [Dongia rigui]
MPSDLAPLRDHLIAAAYEAGAAIMAIYSSDFAASKKADHSPVTEADVAAEKLILAALRICAPDIPVIAEEQAAAEGLPQHIAKRFFLVDPLDGTKEFVARNGEFTVNIALIENGVPVLGVVYLPALGEMYAGHGTSAIRRRDGEECAIAARPLPKSGAVMTISRSHAAKELVKVEELGEHVSGTIVAGSSLKFCRIAEGAADLYPRFGPTMEWDTAAGHAVLLAAGGSVAVLDGTPLVYGKPGLKNPHFIARGRR